jgi:N-acetylglutamate synthase/N-acetylornithine aminotransferase
VLSRRSRILQRALRNGPIRSALPHAFAALGHDQGPAAARAIMTTDPFPKEAAARVVLDGR